MAHSRIVETIVEPISDPRRTAMPSTRRDAPNSGDIKGERSQIGTAAILAAISLILAGGVYFFWNNTPTMNKANQLEITEPMQPLRPMQ